MKIFRCSTSLNREGAPCYLDAVKSPKSAVLVLLAEAATFESIVFFMLFVKMLDAC